MNTPEIVIIAAMDEKRGIGLNGAIPWRISEDMAHFKEATIADPMIPVIMGRVTWDSIPSKFRPLPQRANIVVTKKVKEDFTGQGIKVAQSTKEAMEGGIIIAESIENAIKEATKINPRKVVIMGGAQIYKDTLHLADTFDLTRIEGDFGCDAFLPEIPNNYRIISSEPGAYSWFTSKTGLRYRFQKIGRV